MKANNGYGLYCSGELEAPQYLQAQKPIRSTNLDYMHLTAIDTSRCSTLGGYLAETILRSTKSSFFIFLGRDLLNFFFLIINEL